MFCRCLHFSTDKEQCRTIFAKFIRFCSLHTNFQFPCSPHTTLFISFCSKFSHERKRSKTWKSEELRFIDKFSSNRRPLLTDLHWANTLCRFHYRLEQFFCAEDTTAQTVKLPPTILSVMQAVVPFHKIITAFNNIQIRKICSFSHTPSIKWRSVISFSKIKYLEFVPKNYPWVVCLYFWKSQKFSGFSR